MANTTSAQKADRAAKRRAVFNARRKRAMKDSSKEFEKMIAKKSGEAASGMSALYKAIDKAAKRGVIKKNTAARMKSRAAKQFASLSR